MSKCYLSKKKMVNRFRFKAVCSEIHEQILTLKN